MKKIVLSRGNGSEGKIKIENYSKDRVITTVIEELEKYVPEYLLIVPTRIIILDGKISYVLRSVKSKLEGFYKFKGKYGTIIGFDRDWIVNYDYIEGVLGQRMYRKDKDGNNIIYLFSDKIREYCYQNDQDLYTLTLLHALHELYHVYQHNYWKDIDSLRDGYDGNILEGDIGYEEKYFNHILETTARKWSIDRLNYISGESWIYA